MKTLTEVEQGKYEEELTEYEKLDPETEETRTHRSGEQQTTRRDGIKTISKPVLRYPNAQERTAYAVEQILKIVSKFKLK